MNVAPNLIPISPAQFATIEAAAMPGAALPAVATAAALQPAAFAGVLALAVQPLVAEAKTADAKNADTEPAAGEHKAADGADDTKPAITNGDVTGIARTLNASMIVRDLGALQPAFRAKVERVISRMKEEYGHNVTVTETYRSQSRQDQLLQQGRTTSGPIVTWTSHSLHTQGRAADLQVDGKWNNPEGFQHLQEIASQEGLSTLGPRDPGHIEMREDSLTTIASMAQITEVSVSAKAAPAAGIAQTPPATPVAQVARTPVVARVTPVAQVAQVVQVAQLAQVAQVAQVAQIAEVAHIASTSPTIAPAKQPAPSAQSSPPRNAAAKYSSAPEISAAQSSGTSTDTSSNPRDRHRDQTPADVAAPAAPASRQVPAEQTSKPIAAALTSKQIPAAQPSTAAAAQYSAGTSNAPIAALTLDAPAPIAESGLAMRAAAVLAMQDAKAAQPVSHMTLQLDNADGGIDRIRVGLHGTTVGATIDMHDSGAATDIASNIHQLAAALQSRGLDPDSLRVRVAGSVPAPQLMDLSRIAIAGGDAAHPALGTLFAQATSSSSRSRGDAQGQRPQQDPSRQRARKDQQGEQQ